MPRCLLGPNEPAFLECPPRLLNHRITIKHKGKVPSQELGRPRFARNREAPSPKRQPLPMKGNLIHARGGRWRTSPIHFIGIVLDHTTGLASRGLPYAPYWHGHNRKPCRNEGFHNLLPKLGDNAPHLTSSELPIRMNRSSTKLIFFGLRVAKGTRTCREE